MCQGIIWLCDHAMRLQSKPHISPLLTIESSEAQWLEQPADYGGSRVQIPSGTQNSLRLDVISTLIPYNFQIFITQFNTFNAQLST